MKEYNRCAIHWCRAHRTCDSVSLFKMPTNTLRRKLWLEITGIADHPGDLFICNRHFNENQMIFMTGFSEKRKACQRLRALEDPKKELCISPSTSPSSSCVPRTLCHTSSASSSSDETILKKKIVYDCTHLY